MNTLLLCLAVSTFAAVEELPTPPATNISPEHAARLYRITLYETFREDRGEYQRHRQIGDRLWTRFAATGYPAENKAAVVTWFTSAKEAVNKQGELPPLPEFMALPPGTKVADTIVPVSTSAPRENIRVDVPPPGAITHMEVTLPPQAVQTGPTRVLSTLIKQTIKIATMAEEPSAATSPPKTPTKVEPRLAPPTITLPPQADQVYPEPAKVRSVETKPAPEAFNFDELFAPTTTPVPPKPATDVDPFSP